MLPVNWSKVHKKPHDVLVRKEKTRMREQLQGRDLMPRTVASASESFTENSSKFSVKHDACSLQCAVCRVPCAVCRKDPWFAVWVWVSAPGIKSSEILDDHRQSQRSERENLVPCWHTSYARAHVCTYGVVVTWTLLHSHSTVLQRVQYV